MVHCVFEPRGTASEHNGQRRGRGRIDLISFEAAVRIEIRITEDLFYQSKCASLLTMDTQARKSRRTRNTTLADAAPRFHFQVTARDAAWIIAGMSLAFLVTQF